MKTIVEQQQPVVAVVLCTYNGARHLEEQLRTLALQTWPIHVYAFDDGSTDSTVNILNSFQSKLAITISVNNKNCGYVKNFENGIAAVLAHEHQYIALCDQDDSWEPHRITRGMQALLSMEHELGKTIPILSHSDLQMIDASSQQLHSSFIKYRRYGISEAKSLPLVLGQNGVMGNTILMNEALAKLALPFPSHLHLHDYWLALISELFGQRLFSNEKLVRYRIHSDNASNSSDSIPLVSSHENSPNKAAGNTQAVKKQKTTEKKYWLNRDHELPFKEDNRLQAIEFIMGNTERFGELKPKDKTVLLVFKRYLEFSGSRIAMLMSMFRHGFFRTGIKHRWRVIVRTLLTTRY